MASSGNFCTLNPLAQPNAGTYSEGNLLFTHTASAWRTSFGTHGITSGKWYWEAYQYEDIGTGNGFPLGIYDQDSGQQMAQASQYPGQSNSSYGTGYVVYSSGSKRNNGSETSISSGTAAGTWQCAFDADNGKIWFGKDNTWADSGNPAGGSNEAYSSIPSSTWVPITCSYSDSSSENYVQNFGQDSTFSGRISAGGNADENGFGDFKYAPPSGFLALCSANLPISDDINPAETDDDYPGKQFGAEVFTGNAGTQTIQLGDSFQPDCVWMKNRGTANSWIVVDSSRGYNKTLQLESTNTESTNAYVGYGIESDFFDSTGIKANSGGSPGFNASGGNYIVYGWRGNGGTTASNSNGQTTSTVQANQEAGFSIVQYAGSLTGSGTKTIGHGLSKAPEFYAIKNPDKAGRWFVWHTGMSGASYMLEMNTTSAESDKSGNGSMSLPTNTVFSTNWTEASNEYPYNHIAYVWHSVEGYSKFGKYEGNGSSDGPFIYTGFRPRLFVQKRIDSTGSWRVWDSARHTFNPMDAILRWEDNGAEDANNGVVDFLSNGVKIRMTYAEMNASGGDFVYMCWGDVPFKFNNTF